MRQVFTELMAEFDPARRYPEPTGPTEADAVSAILAVAETA